MLFLFVIRKDNKIVEWRLGMSIEVWRTNRLYICIWHFIALFDKLTAARLARPATSSRYDVHVAKKLSSSLIKCHVDECIYLEYIMVVIISINILMFLSWHITEH